MSIREIGGAGEIRPHQATAYQAAAYSQNEVKPAENLIGAEGEIGLLLQGMQVAAQRIGGERVPGLLKERGF